MDLGDEDRLVVGGGAGLVGIDLCEDRVECFESKAGQADHSQLPVLSVLGFCDSVGVEDQAIARFDIDGMLRFCVKGISHDANQRTLADERLDLVGPATKQQGAGMAGTAVGYFASSQIDSGGGQRKSVRGERHAGAGCVGPEWPDRAATAAARGTFPGHSPVRRSDATGRPRLRARVKRLP